MYSTCSFLALPLGVDFLLFGLISWVCWAVHKSSYYRLASCHIYIHKSWVESIDWNLELLYSIVLKTFVA